MISKRRRLGHSTAHFQTEKVMSNFTFPQIWIGPYSTLLKVYDRKETFGLFKKLSPSFLDAGRFRMYSSYGTVYSIRDWLRQADTRNAFRAAPGLAVILDTIFDVGCLKFRFVNQDNMPVLQGVILQGHNEELPRDCDMRNVFRPFSVTTLRSSFVIRRTHL
jgi:hypothetical protein